MTSYLNRLNKLWISSENKDFYHHVSWLFALEVFSVIKDNR